MLKLTQQMTISTNQTEVLTYCAHNLIKSVFTRDLGLWFSVYELSNIPWPPSNLRLFPDLLISDQFSRHFLD